MRRLIAIALLILLPGSQHLFGQIPEEPLGIIIGQVFDATTTEPIISANVVVVGTTLGGSTDLDGNFKISRVPVGVHAIRVSALGYTTFTKTDIIVSLAKPAELMIPLVESVLQVEGVQVTASYFQKLPDKPLSNLVQTNEEIRRLPGGLEDVVRAISILPGVAQVQAGRNDLIVRGGAPSENLFVIENLEVPNINHFGTQGASGGPLSFVNLDFVEGTSFSTGGFGVMYGDKLSSVLSINLREGRKDRLGGKGTISASQFGLNLEGPTSESSNFIFSARRSYLDFIFKAAGFGFVPEYWDFLGKVHYHLGKGDQLIILGIGALDNVKFFNDTPDKRFNNARILGSDQNQFVGGVSWRHLLPAGFTTLTYGETYVDYNFIQNDSLLAPIFRNTSSENEHTLRAEVLFHAAKSTEIVLGMHGKIAQFKSDIVLRPFSTSYGDSLAVNSSYSTAAFKSAAFVQVSQELGPARITLGGRLDYFNMIENKFVASPRLSGTYSVSPVTNLNASIGRYFQAPSYIWLVANAVNRKLDFVGVDQFIVGVDHMVRADTRISLESYRKNYFDYPTSLTRPYLVLANTGAGFGGSEEGFASFGTDPLASQGSGIANGIEFLVQKKLSEIRCYGTVSISYNVSEFKGLDGIERPSNWEQQWIINVGGGYVFNEKWEISTKFRLATGRPYTPYGPNGSQNPALYNTMRVGTNHSLDFRVDRRWMVANWNLITYIDIQNVYNRQPLDVPRYNSRTGQAEQGGSIGILPSIGISAEF
jgi:hypothetical protein